MDQAISNLSLKCDPKESASALYLLSAPTEEMTMGLIKELVDYLSEVAPRAIIRYGDYPRGKSTLTITLILSQLNSVDKVMEYYDKMPELIQEKEWRQEENEYRLNKMTKASKAVPSLFGGDGS